MKIFFDGLNPSYRVNGQLYTSTDSGTNWTARTGAPTTNWQAVASSSDGTKLAAVAGGGQIYVSADGGTTWTARVTKQNWAGVASTADGRGLVAVANGGSIYTSPDSGVTWTAQTGSQGWNCVTSSADGSKLAAGIGGYNGTSGSGPIYTSVSSLAGVQGSFGQFEYLGNGEWQQITSANVALLNASNAFTGGQNTFSGNVGIGTTSPGAALDVQNANGTALIRAKSTSGGGGYLTLDRAATSFASQFGFATAGANDFAMGTQQGTAGASDFSIYDYGLGNALTILKANGYVGIGTTSPGSTLDVNGTLNVASTVTIVGTAANAVSLYVGQGGKDSDYFWLGNLRPNGNGVSVNNTSFGVPAGDTTDGNNHSIKAANYISAAGFDVISDARIKMTLDRSESAGDLAALQKIHITDYTFKDKVAHGDRPQKKVIAQEVEQVYPLAVSKSTGVVPDIYQQAITKGGWVQLATDLKVGERVKLIGEKQDAIYKVLEVTNGAFRTDFKPATDKVFVYGREVNDFRTVDYDAISMLNVSATQELAKRLENETAEVASLKQELAEMKKLVAQLAQDSKNTRVAGTSTTPPSQTPVKTSQPLVTARLEQ